jgi:hypothetical protein
MARGWESKSVEAQQADREQRSSIGGPVTPEDAALAARRRTLELALARAKADLGRATAPAHRTMLTEAMRALTEQLQALGRPLQ